MTTYTNPAHLDPQPSAESLDLVGKVITYKGDRHKAGPIECTVTKAEKVFSTITRGIDGSLWSAVRFRLKPTNGARAFWTSSMPDEPLGRRSEVPSSDEGAGDVMGTMLHTHDDARPTFGCSACIQTVRSEEFAARMSTIDTDDLLDVAMEIGPDDWRWPIVDAEMERRFGPLPPDEPQVTP